MVGDKWYSSEKLVLYVVLVGTALMPLTRPTDYILHILIMCCIYGLLAASWDLVAGYAGQLTFSHAGFFGLGAYTSALVTFYFGISPWLGLLLGGMASAAVGAIVGLPSLRLRGPYLALTTLALSETLRVVILNSDSVTHGSRGFIGYPPFPGIPHTRVYYLYLALALLFVSILAMYLLARSRIGLGFRAIREDETLAEAHGLNVAFYKLSAFTTSSFFAGVAGAFYAHYLLLITPDQLAPLMTAQIIAMAAIGGLGTICGPVMGAFIVEIGSEYLRGFGVIYNLILVGVTIIAVIVFFPAGIFGRVGGMALSTVLQQWWRKTRNAPSLG